MRGWWIPVAILAGCGSTPDATDDATAQASADVADAPPLRIAYASSGEGEIEPCG